MKYSKLGQTELLVSKIALGCANLNVFDKTATGKLIDYSLERGINYFDTASSYQAGYNEQFLGQMLRNKGNDIIMSTKIGYPTSIFGKSVNKLKSFANLDNHTQPSNSFLIKTLEKSLKNLRVDCIDLLFVHNPLPNKKLFEEFKGQLELFVKEGKIRYYGVSFMNLEDFFLSAEEQVCYQIMQVPLNASSIHHLTHEKKTDLINSKTGIIARQPFAYLKQATGADYRKFSDSYESALGNLYNLQWVNSVVFGTSNLKHLQNNINFLENQ